MTEKTVLSLSYGRILVKPSDKLRGLVPESFETYQIVEPGNIVVRTTDLQNDQTSLRVGYSHDRGIITSAYMCLETKPRLLGAFGYQFLNAYDLLKVIYGFGSGLRQSLAFGDIKRMPVLVPPLAEQAAIVRFLDHADRRIRRYIGAKQKLIKLLEEQKQSIIHRAVTRGLDPNVRLKPSGVDWIGEVPAHWQVVRLGRLVDLLTGFPFKSEGFTQDERDIRLLRGVNVSPGRIRWNQVVRWPDTNRKSFEAFELRADDIVLGMDRPLIRGGTRIASVQQRDLPALLLQRVARLRPNNELDARYLLLLLAGKSFAEYLTPIFTGISVPHLSPEQIKGFRFALPSLSEQREIIVGAGAATESANSALLAAQREIELLGEYRTRLIADVVTGKLDVREAAARLSDEADEPEALDDGEAEAGADEDTESLDASLEETEP